MKSLLLLLCFSVLLSCQQENLPVEIAPSSIFVIVEDNPAFPGCENISIKAEKQACSVEKLNAFIYENLKYPLAAKLAGIEGTVTLKFIVNTDGSISNEEIIRDIGYDCGEEALRIVRLMPPWIPGLQRGEPVRVQKNIQVFFQL
ncbi:MAG: energy transducer TonB [Bacteroidota bacterium]